MGKIITPWRVIMNAKEEIYGKALGIAVLVLGKKNITEDMSESVFQQRIMKYDHLASQIARHIIDAAARIHI
jgi:hypothetical protein